MSIKIEMKAKEGIALKGPKAGLSFPPSVASLLSKNLKAALGNGPVAVFEGSKVEYGRQHPLAAMLGMETDTFQADLRVYPVGEVTIEDMQHKMDAYVSEDSEGNILLAYCPIDVREAWLKDVDARGTMSMLAIEPDELDEALEALGTDLSGEPSIEAEEAEEAKA